jgi:N-acetylglucosaminyldiphosphoundecaprenol N-acetyl-beta-D-mannosaminyltransferase
MTDFGSGWHVVKSGVMGRVDILGVHVDVQRLDEAAVTLSRWAREDRGRYVCTCPVYTLMACQENPEVKRAVCSADMIAADGMPVVWVQHMRGYRSAERVYGPDLLLAVCERTAGPGVRHFFWGGLSGIADKLVDMLKARFPALAIAGAYSPPVTDVDVVPDPNVVERLNSSHADVIWVGLGSPKQDLWMALYRPVLTAPVLVGVGAAFDFLSGAKQQAPRWMQQHGLEWLFRLGSEPKRLWRRYILYNPRFVWQVVRQTLQRSR